MYACSKRFANQKTIIQNPFKSDATQNARSSWVQYSCHTSMAPILSSDSQCNSSIPNWYGKSVFEIKIFSEKFYQMNQTVISTHRRVAPNQLRSNVFHYPRGCSHFSFTVPHNTLKKAFFTRLLFGLEKYISFESESIRVSCGNFRIISISSDLSILTDTPKTSHLKSIFHVF